ncbi:MAG: hypothetical protein OXC62_04835 [Aestuariivita sp.]|nr:hypothetical protein [Aestuariivita sp.]
MKEYKSEPDAELKFSFPEDLVWDELDRQGVKPPVLMFFPENWAIRPNCATPYDATSGWPTCHRQHPALVS